MTVKHQHLSAELIKHLYYNKMLTLAELSLLTNKSLPVVTNVINELVIDGYVLESGLAPSTGGRRALMFLLNPKKQKYIVSVAVDQLVTQMVIYDIVKTEICPPKIITLNLLKDEDVLTKLVRFIKKNIHDSGIPANQFLGVGIGMPGFINPRKGINYSFFNINLTGNLKDYLNEVLDLPVFIDNDSSIIALAELKFGIGRGCKDTLVVNFGWGVGLGMVINGALFKGHSGYAGEFSHIPLLETNTLCSCGKVGCLEVGTSLLVLVEQALVEISNGTTTRMSKDLINKGKSPGDHLLKAAREGDSLAASILSEAAFLIGKGLSTLIQIINPELIVISGRGAMAGEMLMPPIQKAIDLFCIPRLAEQTRISISNMGDRSQLVGAAILVIENCQFI
nr:ROK family protein [Pedobacter panaciterrae]